MSDDFRRVISALWSSLNMGVPAFSEAPTVVLSVDGVDIHLSETEDGRHLDIAGYPGHLSRDALERATQVERILALNTANLLGNRACVGLRRGGGEDADIICQARAPYQPLRLVEISNLIEDVLASTEYWRARLRPARAAPPTRAALQSETLSLETALIFRP